MKNKLRKWLSGDMTRREEEGWLRDDAFAKEAVEGYANMPDADHERALQRLEARLNKKQASKKQPVIWMRIAAALAFLVVASGVFWMVNQTLSDTANVAMEAAPVQKEMQLEDDIVISDAVESEETIEERVTVTNDVAPPPPPLAEVAKPKPAPSNSSVVTTPTSKIEDESEGDAQLDKSEIVEEVAAESMEEYPIAEGYSLPMEMDEAEILDQTAVADYKISGVVQDSLGKPLLGANVGVAGEDQIALTNTEGRFTLSTPQLESDVKVSRDGFRDTTINVRTREDMAFSLQKIQAKPSAKARSRAFSEKKEVNSNSVTASPGIGWEAFEQFLKKEMRYPDAAAKANIEGEVVVQFKVKRNGKLTDFKILESLGYGCDQEAIRLLKASGVWQGNFQNESVKMTYSFAFSPKK